MRASRYAVFKYRDLGTWRRSAAASAVADFGWLQLRGWIGWLAWLFVHILNLIGFRNRLVVLVQWAWAYFTYQRSVRLIAGNDPDSDRLAVMWRAVLVLAAVAAALVPIDPARVEQWYSTGLYPRRPSRGHSADEPQPDCAARPRRRSPA